MASPSKHLTRYWFRSEEGKGVGVTAYSRHEAESLVRSEGWVMGMRPSFTDVIEDIDVRDLDEQHVIPNMGICSERGIWYPKLK